MIFEAEKRIAQAEEEFKSLCEYVTGEAQDQDAYTVEKRLFKEVLRMALSLMAAYFDEKQGGDVGDAVVTDTDDYLPRERLKSKRFICIFGELLLQRWYYHEDNRPGVFPLDEDVNLPERCYSYFVQELTGQRAGLMAYDEIIGELTRLFGFAPYKHSIEDMAAEAAQDADVFTESLPQPQPHDEPDILVSAIDGKGVPIVKNDPAEHKVRLKRGEKRSRKKEATVSTVYTVEPYYRTSEQIVGEIRDRQGASDRPKPHNKRVRATLQSKENGFDWVAHEMNRRDPDGTKKRVCLMDGAKGLWTQALAKLDGCTFILELFHPLEYLWQAAHVLHPEGSDEAEAFVRKRLKMLLDGKVGYVIGGLRQMLVKHRRRLGAQKRKTLHTVINYYACRRQWMHYDKYIAAGLPIGAGAVEGACLHLVKDRMEGSGMRWTVPGAEAVLKLRATHLNGDWDSYWDYHMHCEKQRRFGDCKWRPLPAQDVAA